MKNILSSGGAVYLTLVIRRRKRRNCLTLAEPPTHNRAPSLAVNMKAVRAQFWAPKLGIQHGTRILSPAFHYHITAGGTSMCLWGNSNDAELVDLMLQLSAAYISPVVLRSLAVSEACAARHRVLRLNKGLTGKRMHNMVGTGTKSANRSSRPGARGRAATDQSTPGVKSDAV
jgi:hypothetical protein